MMRTNLSVTCAGLLILSMFSACEEKKAPPPQVMPVAKVTIESVKFLPASYFDEYPATVTALNLVELKPQVNGFITGIHFKDGDRVRKGQLLYTIDNQLYSANYEQAMANLQLQQANLNKAQKDADRYHELDKMDAIAKQVVDNADAALEVTKKQVAAATANIQAMQTNVNYTKIYAPFDGVIGISMVKPGTSVTAGQSLLNTVSSDQEMAVDFNIDQQEIFRFSKILNEPQKASDSTFTLAFGNEIYPVPGKLILLDRAVNSQTGTLKTRLVFPNTRRVLISGMNGTVRVKRNDVEHSVLIPYKAVTEQLGEYFVYVPNDSSKVSQRKITLGKQMGSDIIVTHGLKEGDQIVVEGVQNLREGATVQASPATGSSTGGK